MIKSPLNKIITLIAISAITQSAAAGYTRDIVTADANLQIVSKSVQYMQEQSPTAYITGSFDLLVDTLTVDGETLSLDRHLLATNDDSTQTDGCYTNCYGNCHGSRSWR